MGINKIMTPFLDPGSAAAVFDLSAAVARRFSAHIDVVHVRQDPPIPTSAYHPFPYAYVPVDVHEVEEAAAQSAAELRKIFDQRCAALGVPQATPSAGGAVTMAQASWSDVKGRYPEGFAARGRLADLAVFQRQTAESAYFENYVLEEVLFNSGRPVLVGGGDASLTGRIVVGWNGGREAARALASALPFMCDGGRVEVVTVGALGSGVESGEAVCAYLALHGVAAEAVALTPPRGANAEETFLKHASDGEAALIVTGAYSHSRFREVLLGGFTRYLLAHAEIPLLLAH